MLKNKLHPAAKTVFAIQSFFGFLLLFFILFAWLIPVLALAIKVGGGLSYFFTVIVIFLVLIIPLSIGWAYLTYINFSYEFIKTGLKIEKGVIWKRYSNIPYQRIQNVIVSRGILARILGFSTLILETAGMSGQHARPEGVLPAIEIKNAEKISNDLMNMIDRRRGQGL